MMSARNFSWGRLLGGAVLGGICGMVMLTICAYATGALLGSDEPAGTTASIMVLYGTPIGLVVGVVLGGQAFGFLDRRLFAAIGGGLLGIVGTYLIAIPVSIVYGGALDRTGVLYVLGYGLPIAVVLGAVWGRRRFDRSGTAPPSRDQ
jgi:hypothetical protein